MKSALLSRTALLLICSNTFMTFAWYAHLRNWSDKKWYIAALLSWGIALFEYLFQVPANRLGYETLSLAQLKILQEIITLAVFAPFAVSTCTNRSNSIASGPACVSPAPPTSCSARRHRSALHGLKANT